MRIWVLDNQLTDRIVCLAALDPRQFVRRPERGSERKEMPTRKEATRPYPRVYKYGNHLTPGLAEVRSTLRA